MNKLKVYTIVDIVISDYIRVILLWLDLPRIAFSDNRPLDYLDIDKNTRKIRQASPGADHHQKKWEGGVEKSVLMINVWHHEAFTCSTLIFFAKVHEYLTTIYTQLQKTPISHFLGAIMEK